MQATLDKAALKQFTKALACLTKYGDDMTLHATPQRLIVSSTNSSATAYCRFVYKTHFFGRYRLKGNPPPRDPDIEMVEESYVDGQLATKSLLAVLKHRTVEKTVEKCELSIVDGDVNHGDSSDEERDTLESQLIVRLHCKHGVIKTHKLLLSEAPSHMAPNIPDTMQSSHLFIVPRSLHDILDLFSSSRNVKSDAQLIWCFWDEEVHVRSQQGSLDASGNAQLASELTIAADEFQVYDIFSSPITIAFHLREFSAVIAFAEACGVGIDIRFTEPSEPLFLETDGSDSYEALFVIAMAQVTQIVPSGRRGHPQRQINRPQERQLSQPHGRKRPLDEDQESISRVSSTPQEPQRPPVSANGKTPGSVVKKKPMKAAVRVEPMESPAARRERSVPWSNRDTPTRGNGSMPPPTAIPAWALSQNSQTSRSSQRSILAHPLAGPSKEKEPLFLPSSQLSYVDEAAIRESGLGIENMDRDEFLAMMDDEGEEVGIVRHREGSEEDHGDDSMDFGQHAEEGGQGYAEIDSRPPEWDELEKFEEEYETQFEPSQSGRDDKSFRPLFDD